MKTYINTLDPTSEKLKTTKEIVQFFYRIIGRKACVIFDNVEKEEDIKDLLVDKDSPHIIITTRFSGWKKENMIKLDAFDETDVKIYGEKYFGRKIGNEERLCEMLGGLPLAISQAFAFMKEKKQNVEEYCKKWKENDLIKNEDQTTAIIFNTFILALRDMKRKNPRIDEVLDIIAYISPDHLTRELIEDFNDKKEMTQEGYQLSKMGIEWPLFQYRHKK